MNNVFKQLSMVDVSGAVKKIKGKKFTLSYLSWSEAWTALMIKYPNATYKVRISPDTNLPYFMSKAGFMVFTELTIDEVTREMWLPGMDHNNNNISCENIKMTDVNKTIMRCLTKNIAMFGLGINIYSGEDLHLSADVFLSDDDKVKKAVDIVTRYYEGDKSLKTDFALQYSWAKKNKIKEVMSVVKKYKE